VIISNPRKNCFGGIGLLVLGVYGRNSPDSLKPIFLFPGERIMTYLALSKYKALGALLLMAAAVGLLTMTVTTRPAQAISNTLVVSQVYGGGGNAGAQFTNDFIEIFNRGTTAIDVTGWSVQYTSATGTAWQVTPICATGPCLIQPGKYFLVQ
jgi:hypothetical protein